MGDGQVSPWVAVTRALSGPVAYPGTGSGVAEVEGSPLYFKCFLLFETLKMSSYINKKPRERF